MTQEQYDELTRVLWKRLHSVVRQFWDECDKFFAHLVLSATHTATAFAFINVPTIENTKMPREALHFTIDRILDINGWPTLKLEGYQ